MSKEVKIVCIPDTHFPWVNKKALAQTLQAIKETKPDYVIQLGDLYDQYNFSRYARSFSEASPQEEIAASREAAEQMWGEIGKAAPKSKRIQLLGNHDCRIHKRIMEKVPELEGLLDLRGLYTFDGVKTLHSDTDEVQLHGIMFHHGYLGKLGDHMRRNGISMVVGHSHRGGVAFDRFAGGVLWELNAGHLADTSAKALQYGPQKTHKWTLGYGLITIKDGIARPQFIPLE